MFRPVKVRQYLHLMKEKGHDPDAVLAGSGVTQDKLAKRDFLMDIEQARVVVSNMIALTGDQGIGLEMGAKTEMHDLGLMGYLMLSARSTREAVNYWLSYSNALVGMPMRLRLEERSPNDWSLTFEESAPQGFIYNFCVEEQMVMIYKLGGEIADTIPAPVIELSYPAPAHHERYRNYLPCPIRFNSRFSRITFSEPTLSQPIRGNDPDFNEICERQCEMLVRQIGERSPFVSKIRGILLRSRGEVPTLQALAEDMHVSSRTLRRRLEEEGITYQRLVNEFRSDLAKEYVRSASLRTKEIAYQLGFKNTNSFCRTFKKWTGMTVQQYRAKS